MATTQIIRWATRSVLRHPAPWLLVAVFLAVWPTMATFTGLALTTDRGSLPGLLQQLTSIALLAGVLWGRSLANRADWLLARAVGVRRLWAEALLLATPALIFGISAMAAPLLAGSLTATAIAELGGQVLPSLLHLVSMALVLGHGVAGSPGRRQRRSWWSLPVLGWLIPSWLSGASPLGAHIADWLDFRLSMAPFEIGAFGHPVLTASLPIVAWSLAAILLATAPLSAHALRRSR